MTTLAIRDASDVEQAVRDALAAEQPLEIAGHRSKHAIGQPTATNAVLDLSALNAVTSYEPSELIITAQAGAPLADVLSLIDSRNQEFAFEPMKTSVLMGTSRLAGTLGGMIAAGLAGPRRIKAGGVRDHLLGVTAVSGFGETFKTGGKVVKNVTGYDLCKLLSGSWGTLAAMTEVTLKVMPKAESEITLVLHGLDDAMANRAMTTALGSPFDVSAAAHLPAALTGTIDGLSLPGAATLVRLEGIEASIAHRAGTLTKLLQTFGAAGRLSNESSRTLWASIRDVAPFAAAGLHGNAIVWRIVCPPASGSVVGAALMRGTGGALYYDWGGGLIWAALPGSADGHAKIVRDCVDAAGGHATLIRASETLRAATDVFHPLPDGVAALNRRVKASFDPRHIFNRGRMARMAAS